MGERRSRRRVRRPLLAIAGLGVMAGIMHQSGGFDGFEMPKMFWQAESDEHSTGNIRATVLMTAEDQTTSPHRKTGTFKGAIKFSDCQVQATVEQPATGTFSAPGGLLDALSRAAVEGTYTSSIEDSVKVGEQTYHCTEATVVVPKEFTAPLCPSVKGFTIDETCVQGIGFTRQPKEPNEYAMKFPDANLVTGFLLDHTVGNKFTLGGLSLEDGQPATFTPAKPEILTS
jgi:hypothetical protein